MPNNRCLSVIHCGSPSPLCFLVLLDPPQSLCLSFHCASSFMVASDLLTLDSLPELPSDFVAHDSLLQQSSTLPPNLHAPLHHPDPPANLPVRPPVLSLQSCSRSRCFVLAHPSKPPASSVPLSSKPHQTTRPSHYTIRHQTEAFIFLFSSKLLPSCSPLNLTCQFFFTCLSHFLTVLLCPGFQHHRLSSLRYLTSC